MPGQTRKPQATRGFLLQFMVVAEGFEPTALIIYLGKLPFSLPHLPSSRALHALPEGRVDDVGVLVEVGYPVLHVAVERRGHVHVAHPAGELGHLDAGGDAAGNALNYSGWIGLTNMESLLVVVVFFELV